MVKPIESVDSASIFSRSASSSAQSLFQKHSSCGTLNREAIMEDLIKLAETYVLKAVSSDAQAVLEHGNQFGFDKLRLQTFQMPLEEIHKSNNPVAPLLEGQDKDLRVYVTIGFVPGLTTEMFKLYTSKHVKKANHNFSRSEQDYQLQEVASGAGLDPHYPTYVTKINMPFMFAPRALVNTYYSKKVNGVLESLNSSFMNEELTEQSKRMQQPHNSRGSQLINEDTVIAYNHINYVKLKPHVAGDSLRESISLRSSPVEDSKLIRENEYGPGESGRQAPDPVDSLGCHWTSVFCLDVGGLVNRDLRKALAEAFKYQGKAFIEKVLRDTGLQQP